MQETRLKILLEYLEQEPNEPFNRFAVAMEYMKRDLSEARKHLEVLMKEQPGYLPLYYQLGQIYTEAEEYALGESVYTKGIDLAKEKGDAKTEKELSGAYRTMKEEQEEW